MNVSKFFGAAFAGLQHLPPQAFTAAVTGVIGALSLLATKRWHKRCLAVLILVGAYVTVLLIGYDKAAQSGATDAALARSDSLRAYDKLESDQIIATLRESNKASERQALCADAKLLSSELKRFLDEWADKRAKEPDPDLDRTMERQYQSDFSRDVRSVVGRFSKLWGASPAFNDSTPDRDEVAGIRTRIVSLVRKHCP